MDSGHRERGRLNFAVRGSELLDGTKTAASKLARDRVSPGSVGINHSHQPYGSALSGELMVNAGMVAAECADTNHSDVNKVIGCQSSVPRWKTCQLNQGLFRGCLFQQCNLPGMIKLVLHDAAEHIEKIVVTFTFARNLLGQTRIRKGRNRLH